jgi:hypothetical protein
MKSRQQQLATRKEIGKEIRSQNLLRLELLREKKAKEAQNK